MAKKLVKVLLAIVTFSVLVVAGGVWGVYAYYVTSLPSDTSPSKITLPEIVLYTEWFSETKTVSMVMVPTSPWTWVRSFAGEGIDALPTSSRVASYAARSLLNRNQVQKHHLSWQLQWTAASIWISRNWKAEEAIATILNEQYFGHEFRGIRQAAQGYFGLRVEDLSVSEAVLIAGLVKAPSAYDPWCNSERANAYAESLLQKLDPKAKLSPKLLPVPQGTCIKK